MADVEAAAPVAAQLSTMHDESADAPAPAPTGEDAPLIDPEEDLSKVSPDELKGRYEETCKEITRLQQQLANMQGPEQEYVDILQKILTAQAAQQAQLQQLNKVIEAHLHREIHVHLYRSGGNEVGMYGPSSPKSKHKGIFEVDPLDTKALRAAAAIPTLEPAYTPGPGHSADNMDFGTELNYHAYKGNAEEVTRVLSEHPEMTTLTDVDGGWTALHFAASEGKADVVALLLPAMPGGAEAKSSAGKTALEYAMRDKQGDWEGVVALLGG